MRRVSLIVPTIRPLSMVEFRRRPGLLGGVDEPRQRVGDEFGFGKMHPAKIMELHDRPVPGVTGVLQDEARGTLVSQTLAVLIEPARLHQPSRNGVELGFERAEAILGHPVQDA